MPSAATQPPIDNVFRALADPTRRRVLERLARSHASASELAEPFSMALPSFMQHLQLLELSGLVSSRKQGRIRTFELAPQRMQLAEEWLSSQRDSWQQRLSQLDDYVLKLNMERL